MCVHTRPSTPPSSNYILLAAYLQGCYALGHRGVDAMPMEIAPYSGSLFGLYPEFPPSKLFFSLLCPAMYNLTKTVPFLKRRVCVPRKHCSTSPEQILRGNPYPGVWSSTCYATYRYVCISLCWFSRPTANPVPRSTARTEKLSPLYTVMVATAFLCQQMRSRTLN